LTVIARLFAIFDRSQSDFFDYAALTAIFFSGAEFRGGVAVKLASILAAPMPAGNAGSRIGCCL
jgi:hypothetical protein